MVYRRTPFTTSSTRYSPLGSCIELRVVADKSIADSGRLGLTRLSPLAAARAVVFSIERTVEGAEGIGYD
jgi:hypothetical protein